MQNTPVLSMTFGTVKAECAIVALYGVLYEADLYRYCERQKNQKMPQEKNILRRDPLPGLLAKCLLV